MTSTLVHDNDIGLEYYDYEIVDENDDEVNVNVNTVYDDDDDYTYEDEILKVVMEDDNEDVHSTLGPTLLPEYKSVPLSTIDRGIIPLTPSKQRAQTARMTGLSELSKSVRILQAKNESQSVDINRLERQLRILADLQGISVNDLRNALKEACANEAFAELQSRVAKLKFELESATLAKRAELTKDAAAPYISNLELRVGELEEIEMANNEKVENLYAELRQGRSETTRLESENQQLKRALQNMINRLKNETARAAQLETDFNDQMQSIKQNQAKRMNEEGKLNSSAPISRSSGITPEIANEYSEMVDLLKEKDKQLRGAQSKLHADEIRRAEKLKNSEERAQKIQMNMKVEMDKLALTVKELEDADNQSALRLAQFKARFSVQDERITDMGQQLDSLYTAFTLLKEEFDSEHDRHAAMLSNLNDADAEIARQTNKMDNEENKRRNSGEITDTPVFGGSNSSVQSSVEVPRFINTSPSVVENSALNAVMTTSISPSSTPNTMSTRGYFDDSNVTNNTHDMSHGYVTPISHATVQTLQSSPPRTPTTWQLLFPDKSSYTGIEVQQQQQEQLISGPLIVESNSILRKWKTKSSTIYLRGEGYQWKIGDKKSFPIQFGISKVEYNTNYPLSFMVHLNPSVSTAPVIRGALSNERDYHRWMTALYKATSGIDYDPGTSRWSPSHQREARRVSYSSGISNEPSMSPDSSTRSMSSAPNIVEQEAAALERILEISKRET